MAKGLADAKNRSMRTLLFIVGALLLLSTFGVGNISQTFVTMFGIVLALFAIMSMGTKMLMKMPKSWQGFVNWAVLLLSVVFIITIFTSFIGWFALSAEMTRWIFGILGAFWVLTAFI